MDVRQKFGLLLRKIRIEKAMTQEELAHQAGMSVPYLSDIERGRSAPSLVVLADLATALGITMADMFRDFEITELDRDGGRKRPRD
ncbi:helix-turn-helix domain-containing protein [Magnetospirillum gryphiswaldense]|uniref:Helix-turn-helix motif n=1 Tax=Magnetospirillum gryphiswaldense TaxID=55518 RepID=A4TVX6_9PROT|nr:helix-turn-helix transcriptional regulator [Magnetospirillum gryphiswaldense]AVM76180.1 Transcriptional regulator ClgR [Magnetospirillum gryphiswaldense MSR-1]AVM80083.1 Transcriptional regulator ClgR [Magnetospirillum gryphiswaldense]CAM74783.1 Helix-turn-helix motif [Magnetospirillum gryphiswaldense MSR-1]